VTASQVLDGYARVERFDVVGSTNDVVRGWLAEAGFSELDYRQSDHTEGERAALGAARYEGPLQPLILGQQIFTFLQ
jgi:hypothetical protein